GGWHTGFLSFEPSKEWGFWWGNLLDIAVFIGKCWALVLVMIWMRWSLPRLRIDQVRMTCLKDFLPISCVFLVGVCAWKVVVPRAVANVVKYVLAVTCAVGLFVMFVSVFRTMPQGPTTAKALPGAWEDQPVAAKK